MSVWIGFTIYAISLLGYTKMLRRLGSNPYLSWVTAMLIQILMLYVFAMIGWLTIGIQFVTYLGIGLTILWLGLSFFQKTQLKFEGVHLFDLWMACLGIMMGKTLWESPLVHYDNFSHWAVIVKFIVFTGRLPGANDHLISFTSYPPATALFIAQFVHWVGFSDGAMLVAQFLLIWGAAYTIFAGLRDRSRALTSFILCFSLAISFVFNVAIRLNNLLVDYVLPIITIGALIGIFVYRQRPFLLCAHVTIFMATLLLVKNSATFFVIMIVGYYIYTLITNHRWHWRRLLTIPIQMIVTLGVGIFPFAWWEWHVKHIFPVSKHQISTQAYAKQLGNTSHQALLKISHKFLTQIFSLSSLSTKGILLINVTLILTWLFIRVRQHQRNNLLGMAILLDVIFIAYYGSLFGMYILSMPYAEAILLDGFERYMSSIVILNLFIGTIALVRVLDNQMFEQNFQKRNNPHAFKNVMTKNIYQIMTLVVGFFSITMMYSEITGTKFTNEMNHNTLPLQMTRVSKQWHHLNHRKVLIVDPEAVDVNDYYAGYVGRYWYFTDKAVGQEDFRMTPKVFKQTVEKYQYVAIPETHRTFTVLTKKVFHQHVVTGLFKVTKHHLVRVH